MAGMFGYRKKKTSSGMREGRDEKADDGPPGYEGKEHVKYKDPGYSKHNIRTPEDEPHMKSHVSREEEHEAEDDYHMDLPQQTYSNLPKHIKRARMNMDAPDQEEPKPLLGNLVTMTTKKGYKDETGEEIEGPNEMQKDEEGLSKPERKKMIVAVVKRKMGKIPGYAPSRQYTFAQESF